MRLLRVYSCCGETCHLAGADVVGDCGGWYGGPTAPWRLSSFRLLPFRLSKVCRDYYGNEGGG